LLHTKEGKTYLCDFPLKSLEEKLDKDFLRVHRALLVNKTRISEIDKHFGSRFVIKMNDINQSKLMTGRNYCDQIKMLMEI